MNTTICDDERDGEPQPVGEILEELLAQYEAKFPSVQNQCRGNGGDRSLDQGGLNMLVLTRKPGERIIIDDRITVTVLEVQGNRIRLGIEAPKEIPVMREELVGSVSGGGLKGTMGISSMPTL